METRIDIHLIDKMEEMIGVLKSFLEGQRRGKAISPALMHSYFLVSVGHKRQKITCKKGGQTKNKYGDSSDFSHPSWLLKSLFSHQMR